jgi:chemotaxis family two-component system response regulator Rcp1
MTNTRLMRVLIVEDNPGDLDLVMQVLSSSSVPHAISVAVDGVDALDQLRGADALPDLMILDLNLPKKDGRELLRDIKRDPLLQHIPVVVFSSSEANSDLADAYHLHANCFVTKPPDLDDFIAAVRGIDQFWFKLAKLPPAPPAAA